MNVGEILLNLWNKSGFAAIITGFVSQGGWQNLVMLAIACVLLYLAIVKKFEPLLLVASPLVVCFLTCPAQDCTIRSCGMPLWIPPTPPITALVRLCGTAV